MNRRQFLKSALFSAVVSAVPMSAASLLASMPQVDPFEAKARKVVKDTLAACRRSHGPISGDTFAEEDINILAFLFNAAARDENDEQAKVWSMAHRRFAEFAYEKAA